MSKQTTPAPPVEFTTFAQVTELIDRLEAGDIDRDDAIAQLAAARAMLLQMAGSLRKIRNTIQDDPLYLWRNKNGGLFAKIKAQ